MNNEVEMYEGELRHLREFCAEQRDKVRQLVLDNTILTERLKLINEISARLLIRVEPE